MPTACSIAPAHKHPPKVVDYSRPVNSQSHNGALNVHGPVNSSRSAMALSTAGESTLPEGTADWFAVTRQDGSVVLVTQDSPAAISANMEASYAPVSRAGCTVNEGYHLSETRRLCCGIESPRSAQEVGRGITAAPAPPTLPQQIISAHWRCPWIDAAKPINPEGYLQ